MSSPLAPTLTNTGTRVNPLPSSLSQTSLTNGTSNFDFMQLLVEQLKNQSPLDPTNSDTMVQQMSMMAMVQQMTSLNTNLTNWAKSESLGGTTAMIGRTATVLDPSGQPVSGLVSGVAVQNGGVSVQVGGNQYPLSQIVNVQ